MYINTLPKNQWFSYPVLHSNNEVEYWEKRTYNWLHVAKDGIISRGTSEIYLKTVSDIFELINYWNRQLTFDGIWKYWYN